MSNYINELKKEHVEIKKALDRIDDIGHFTKAVRVELMIIREHFLVHLTKEDSDIYPKLQKASLEDEELKNMFQFFQEEAELISKFVRIFIDRYSSRNASADGFQREFNMIYSVLLKRIENEEEILFPEYEKLI